MSHYLQLHDITACFVKILAKFKRILHVFLDELDYSKHFKMITEKFLRPLRV